MSENKKQISDIIKQILNEPDDLSSPIAQKEVAEILGYKLPTFRNKLSLDRFSVKDLMVISEMCNYNLAFVPKGNDKENILLSCDKYLEDGEEKDRLNMFKNSRSKIQLKKLNNLLKGLDSEQRNQMVHSLNLPDYLKKYIQEHPDELGDK